MGCNKADLGLTDAVTGLHAWMLLLAKAIFAVHEYFEMLCIPVLLTTLQIDVFVVATMT